MHVDQWPKFINHFTKWFSLNVTLHQETSACSNNPIRSQDIFTKHWLISPCPRQDIDKRYINGENQSTSDLIWI